MIITAKDSAKVSFDTQVLLFIGNTELSMNQQFFCCLKFTKSFHSKNEAKSFNSKE